jgi:hypothetical protein
VKYKVIIRPEAENDLKEAFSWYEDKRLELGYDFLLQVDAGLKFIERNPEVHSFRWNIKEQENTSSKGFHTKSFILLKKKRQ